MRNFEEDLRAAAETAVRTVVTRAQAQLQVLRETVEQERGRGEADLAAKRAALEVACSHYYTTTMICRPSWCFRGGEHGVLFSLLLRLALPRPVSSSCHLSGTSSPSLTSVCQTT